MTDTIRIKYDFDTLVSKIFATLRGDASYEMEEEKSFSGYIKFTVKHLHLGKAGDPRNKKTRRRKQCKF